MVLRALRWFGKNLTSLLLAFILALVVWVSAVTTSDPYREQQLLRPVPLEIIGLDPGLIVIGSPATQVRFTLNAPNSIWTQLNREESAVRAWLDLSGLEAGTYVVRVRYQVNIRAVEVVRVDPEEVQITLDPLVSETFTVRLQVSGDIPVGYNAGNPTITPERAMVSGARSLVASVREVRASLDIGGEVETIETTLPLQTFDENGNPVNGVSITPGEVAVVQPINLRGGFQSVIVRLVTTGSPAPGYRISNMFVTPPNVIVFSSDPQLVNELPGYVETEALDLTGIQDDFETLLDLDLPQGVTAVSENKILVQVSIAAIESSISITIPIQAEGLMPGFDALLSPANAELVLSGPLPVLNNLKPADIHILVDMTGKGLGTYQEPLVVSNVPVRLQIDSISPESVEVEIVIAPTPTPVATGTPGGTPSPTRPP